MKTVELPNGEAWPALGLGTWNMGESPAPRAVEVAAVGCAIEIGYRVIDTTEMYGVGSAETVVGQALGEALRAGAVGREQRFIVS
jgi:diketogulonate reductase-like aldo/keto reductase